MPYNANDAEYIHVKSVKETENEVVIEQAECDLCDKIKTLTLAQSHQASLDVLDAVRYLHNKKYCHMDIKPANILWSDKEWGKIM